MGGSVSMPFPEAGTNPGYVAVNLRMWNKVRVFYAPPDVKSLMETIVLNVGGNLSVVKDKCGASQYYLPGGPFRVNGGKSDATTGKFFILLLLGGMRSLGYDFVTSSDLSRLYDQSTLFFKKVSAEGQTRRMTCVAPGGWDKLILLHHDNAIQDCITKCIQSYWSAGIQNEEDLQSMGQRLHEFKLRGQPWFSTDRQSTEARNLLHMIIANMSAIGWKFHACVNIKGGTDSMFFVKENHTKLQTSVVSLNRTDRIRFMGELSSDQRIVDAVKTCIEDNWQPGETLSIRDYYGAVEFKLKGHPFHCSGMDAVGSRRLICKIFETLQWHGWAPLTGNDLSRKSHDKSVITMVRCNPGSAKYACVALSDIDKIRFIGFPSGLLSGLQDVVRNSYGYGVQDERQKANDCYEFKLNGMPWNSSHNNGLHGRSMLLHILKKANEQGWHLKASLDVSAKYVHQENGPNYPIDVHSWYFTNASNSDIENDNAGGDPFGASAPPPPSSSMYPGLGSFGNDLPPSYFDATKS